MTEYFFVTIEWELTTEWEHLFVFVIARLHPSSTVDNWMEPLGGSLPGQEVVQMANTMGAQYSSIGPS